MENQTKHSSKKHEPFVIVVSAGTSKDDLAACVFNEFPKTKNVEIRFCGMLPSHQVVKAISSVRRDLLIKCNLDFSITPIVSWEKGSKEQDRIVIYTFILKEAPYNEEALKRFKGNSDARK